MRFRVHVGEVMRKEVRKLDMSEPIKRAAEIMRDDNIGSIVVVGEKNIKGIVTMTDIVYKHVADEKGKTIGDIMTKNPVTISPNRTIEEAARLMVGKNIEKLLVFDKNRLIGIITNNDILKVEPALFEILLEQLRIIRPAGIRRGIPRKPGITEFAQCESCGNYSDTIKEIGGRFICSECR